MAKETQVIYIDDLDGGKADETLAFSLDGVSYEIDLSDKNAAKLRDSLAGYIDKARKVGGKAGARGRGRSTGTARKASSAKTGEIRAWAKANGYEVNERGRIPATVVEQYETAHA